MPRPFVDVFCQWDADIPMSRIAIVATREHYGVVPVYPLEKRPMCTLTARDFNKAGPDHPCGASHAITEDKVAKRVFERLERDNVGLNIGIVARPSRLVVVDADVPEAVDSFRSAWATGENNERYLEFGPTVSTPGTLNAAGEWKHHDGGHWYFDVPAGIELPLDCDQLIGPGGYDVRWGNLLTVAPPSRRTEGRYISNGDALVVPRWLLAVIQHHGEERRERHDRWLERYVNDPIARWAADVTWLELLCRHGWRYTEHLDRRCGCPVFEKPGGGSSGERSAIGHDDECQLYENYEGHGPLHLWTTDPPEPLATWTREHGTQTLTKLQYVAVMEHAGDIERAKVALGIELPLAERAVRIDEWLGATTPPAPEPELTDDEPEPEPDVDHDDDDMPPPPRTGAQLAMDAAKADCNERELRRVINGLENARADGHRDHILRAHFLDENPHLRLDVRCLANVEPQALEPTMVHIDGGTPILYPGRVNTIWGPSDSGKSWFALYACLDVQRHGGKALIIDVEDDAAGWRYRIETLRAECTNLIHLRPYAPFTDEDEAVIARLAAESDIIVIDSLDAFVATVAVRESNSNTDIRAIGNRFKRWVTLNNAAGLIVDHATDKRTGEKSTTSLGASAKKAIIDGVMLRADRETRWRPGEECRTLIMIGKDRHGWAVGKAEFDPTDKDERAFGRLARLRLWSGNPSSEVDVYRSVLNLERPPTFTEQPATAEADLETCRKAINALLYEHAQCDGEGRVLEADWVALTTIEAKTGHKGDKSGVVAYALESLERDGQIEHQASPNGKHHRYRLLPG